MNIKELKYIADIEMMRDGHLSKGIRLEVLNAAKNGNHFTIEVSTDDCIRLGAEMRRAGKIGCMVSYKAGKPNRRVVTFNQPK